MDSKPSAIVCGGGIGGLTAAHELVKKGFKVTVFERNEILGGLARSTFLNNENGTYPTEYSWRVYGTGYKNLLQLLKEIPLSDQPNKRVFDNLVKVSSYIFPRFDKEEATVPEEKGYFKKMTEDFEKGDLRKMIEKIFYCNTISADRMNSMDHLKWKDFCSDISEEAQKYMVQMWGPVLGMDTTYMSFPVVARLIGLLLGGFTGTPSGFYLMNQPTNMGWFDEWSKYLQSQGVEFKTENEITDFKIVNDQVDAVVVRDKEGNQKEVTADYYVCNLSVEVAAKLLSNKPELKDKPVFSGLPTLAEKGKQIQLSVQIYLDKELIYPTDNEIVLYLPDTPWAIIIEPEARVWKKSHSTNSRVKTVLSVGICQTDIPGIKHKKAFVDCTPEEVEEEVWAQLDKSYHMSRIKTEDGKPMTREDQVLFYMWDSFEYDSEKKRIDVWEPKFSNNIGTFDVQPESKTPLKNLYFASGYTKTDRFIYSMESSTEAGILAANAITEDSNVGSKKKVYRLKRTSLIFEPLVFLDSLLFKMKLPHLSKIFLGSSLTLVIVYLLILLGLVAWAISYLVGILN